MTSINIKANGSAVTYTLSGKITSGMVGLDVHIEYDDQWSGLNKTAFFRSGDFVRKREAVGVYTTVPWEVLRKHGKTLDIGLEGRDADGNIVMPTVWATIGTIFQGAQGNVPAAPNPGSGNGENVGGAVIDDSQASLSTTWSSKKIGDMFDQTAEGAQSNLENAMHEVWHDLGLKVATVNGITPDKNGNVQIETGGSADEEIARMKKDQPNLFSELVQTGNLLDASKMVDGYRVIETGELGALASAIASDYIDISKAQGTHLAMYTCTKSTNLAYRSFYRMCFYDANKVKLSYHECPDVNVPLTTAYLEIPQGAVYARVSFTDKAAARVFMVVRGDADTPLVTYPYTPLENITVVPKDLNEKLSVIDDMAKSKHQDNAEFTITTLNNSSQFSQNDITFVGDELWVSKENATYYTNGTMIFRYKVVNGEFTLVGTCDCDFGHLNTMDYCAANDCLIFGNGGNGTETTGNYFVVVKNPLSLGSTALIADVGIKYDVDIGYKVQALWGDSNLGDNNIVYLLSNNAANITKVLLKKGDDGEFNGEFVTLESHELESWGVQGADIFGDTLYIGGQLNGNEYAAVKEISLSDFTTTRTVKQKFYGADGTAITGCVQGIYANKDSVWICVNSGDTSKPVCLTKYNR